MFEFQFLGLLLTSGENFMSVAPSEIYLLRKKFDAFSTYFPCLRVQSLL